MPTIIFTKMWKGFPFFAVMLLAAMQAIPGDLYEAARVDGASTLRSFWHITLPSVRPTILIATLLGVIWTFNSIDLIYILTYGGPYYSTFTLAMFAYQQAFGRGLVGYASAVAVVILALMAVVMAIYLGLYRICLACVVVFVVTPFLWMLLGSFKPTYELLQQQGQTLWIAHPTLENY